jgi:hypothetical protein
VELVSGDAREPTMEESLEACKRCAALILASVATHKHSRKSRAAFCCSFGLRVADKDGFELSVTSPSALR